eukprot:10051767-Alexandrium_andersonii.AAC.1
MHALAFLASGSPMSRVAQGICCGLRAEVRPRSNGRGRPHRLLSWLVPSFDSVRSIFRCVA